MCTGMWTGGGPCNATRNRLDCLDFLDLREITQLHLIAVKASTISTASVKYMWFAGKCDEFARSTVYLLISSLLVVANSGTAIFYRGTGKTTVATEHRLLACNLALVAGMAVMIGIKVVGQTWEQFKAMRHNVIDVFAVSAAATLYILAAAHLGWFRVLIPFGHVLVVLRFLWLLKWGRMAVRHKERRSLK